MARLQERLDVQESEPEVAKRARRADVRPQPYVIPNAPQQPPSHSASYHRPAPRNRGTLWQWNCRSFRGKHGAIAQFIGSRDSPFT